MPLTELNGFGGVYGRVCDLCVVYLSLKVRIFPAVLPDLDQIPRGVEHQPDLRESQERFFVTLIELSCAYKSTPAVLIRSRSTSEAMQDTHVAPYGIMT